MPRSTGGSSGWRSTTSTVRRPASTRTSPASFLDYFDSLLGWEPFRAAQYGIAHHCTLALNPKEANDPRCLPVLDELPRYLLKDQVVAVGEIGYDSMTPAEDAALAAQLQLAADHGLPALVHTPHRDKLAGLRRTVDAVRASALAPERVLLDHLNETTVKEAKDSGSWLGFSVYPDTKMDEERMVAVLKEFGPEKVLVNSAADWGRSDPLKTRKVGDAMLAAGFTEDDVERVLWHNPVAFYGLSGRLDLDVAGTAATHEGNSILRGAPGPGSPEEAPDGTPATGA
ncbi:TatD family hydrolase [Streptomyces sp. NPDC005568]|uniref:TatD family hydrolase n=1 Tax=Streptomyces sp. NPDC005568 TaxID=3156887 RepID=UPI0033AD99A9